MNRIYYIIKKQNQMHQFIRFKPRKYSTISYDDTNNNNGGNDKNRIVLLVGCIMYYIYSRKIR